MFPMHANLVLFAIVVYLAHTGSQWAEKKTARMRLKLDAHPAYVQKFVSRMMSKYPTKAEDRPRGMSGFSIEPNVGHEPYWTNLPDVLWEKKCSHCPALFQEYGIVCALDYSGEVMVNITMCKLLEMNCLKGLAYGRTRDRERDLGYFYVVDEGWARLAVRQGGPDLHIVLAHTPDGKEPYYWITIDGSGGKSNFLYKNNNLWQWHNNGKGYRVLNNDTFTEFVMYWNSQTGWFLITLSKYTDYRNGFYFSFTDPNPFPIKYIAVSGTDYTNEWILKDLPSGLLHAGFLVNQLKPCYGYGVAKFVPTIPTAVPVVMSKISPGNTAYFSRVNFANVNQDQVSFLTKEEY